MTRSATRESSIRAPPFFKSPSLPTPSPGKCARCSTPLRATSRICKNPEADTGAAIVRAMKKLRNGLPCALFVLLASAPISAQEKPASEPARPPEGTTIINLPSAQVNGPRVLQLFITHRFSEPVSDSNIHTLFSFDSGADIGLGLSYVPLKNLEIGFLRNRNLEDYELSARYQLLSPAGGPAGLALRLGGDARTQSTPSLCETTPRPAACSYVDHRYTFFAHFIVTVTSFSQVYTIFIHDDLAR